MAPVPATAVQLAVLAGLVWVADSLSIGAARTFVVHRAATLMVDSWYDNGVRLTAPACAVTVESWYDSGSRLKIPAGMSAAAAVASPDLLAKALKYEAEVADKRARMDSFPKKEGTMFCALALRSHPRQRSSCARICASI